MILAVSFSKGGTAKTTVAAGIIAAAREQGLKTLAIDADPQNNLTEIMDGDSNHTALQDILRTKNPAPVRMAIQDTPQGALIAAGMQLTAAQLALYPVKTGRNHILKKALAPILNEYDLIVIDTPPAQGVLVANVLTAADFVLLPIQARTLSIMGLYQTAKTIDAVRQVARHNIQIEGIVYTMHNPARLLARELSQAITEQAEQMNTRILSAYIPVSESIPQAQAMRQSIIEYAPHSKAADAFRALFTEVWTNIQADAQTR